jgi:hypothetical protein
MKTMLRTKKLTMLPLPALSILPGNTPRIATGTDKAGERHRDTSKIC